MGLAAFVLPERWMVATPLPGLDHAALAALRSERSTLTEQLHRQKPAHGTEGEHAALRLLVRLGLSMAGALGPEFVEALRSGVDKGLSELIAKELATAETARKFALRQIEQGLHTFGVLVESIAAVVADLPAPSVAMLLAEGARKLEHGDASFSADERLFLRFDLDLLMAFESLDGPLDELTYPTEARGELPQQAARLAFHAPLTLALQAPRASAPARPR